MFNGPQETNSEATIPTDEKGQNAIKKEILNLNYLSFRPATVNSSAVTEFRNRFTADFSAKLSPELILSLLSNNYHSNREGYFGRHVLRLGLDKQLKNWEIISELTTTQQQLLSAGGGIRYTLKMPRAGYGWSEFVFRQDFETEKRKGRANVGGVIFYGYELDKLSKTRIETLIEIRKPIQTDAHNQYFIELYVYGPGTRIKSKVPGFRDLKISPYAAIEAPQIKKPIGRSYLVGIELSREKP